jgi:glycosyltransferase involved in cell wall biosynthesis
MPEVSVLLPCYNAAETLNTALTSLTRQTMADFEIIVVDDGSTDGSPALLEAWRQREPRLRCIHQPHAGIIPALNTGLDACQAQLIARMDTDDRAHPERLARQYAFLEANRDIAVAGCLVEAFPVGQVREGFQIYISWLNSLVTDDDIRREIFVESPLVHPSVMFRKDWVIRAGGYQERGWAEDYDLWLRLYLAGARFGKVPESLLDWREHPDRLTRTDGRYALENFLRAKAHYLVQGPLAGRDAVFIWGAGMMGRRLSKHLLREGAPLVAFLDIDPRKIGRTRRGRPILAPDALPDWWARYAHPVLLAAVGARGARPLIRARLAQYQLREGADWWSAA